MNATATTSHWMRAIFLAVATIAPSSLAAGCTDDPCPESPKNWESVRLTEADMISLVRDFQAIDAREISCELVPMGMDARYNVPVYAERICHDLCPDYAEIVLTYGPGIPEAVCDATLTGCKFFNGASIMYMRCMPVGGQGYTNGTCY